MEIIYLLIPVSLVLVIVIDSLPDIKRYFEIRDMLGPIGTRRR